MHTAMVRNTYLPVVSLILVNTAPEACTLGQDSNTDGTGRSIDVNPAGFPESVFRKKLFVTRVSCRPLEIRYH